MAHRCPRAQDGAGLQVAGDEVFDINAICVGGWIGMQEWETKLVPWLIREACPRSTGDWWPTHAWELPKPHNVRVNAAEGRR